MNLTDLIGFSAGALILSSMIPQIIKSWRTKQTKDLSLLMFVIYVSGIMTWLVYGLLLKSYPIIITNSINLILASTNLYLKIKHG